MIVALKRSGLAPLGEFIEFLCETGNASASKIKELYAGTWDVLKDPVYPFFKKDDPNGWLDDE